MMKKILLILALVGLSVAASAQTTNPFPTTDSLRKFINKWIRNSAVDAFTNLRLNTAMIGITRFIDSSDANGKLSLSDTAAMLSGYVRISRFLDSCAALRAAIGSGGGPTNAVIRTNTDLGRLPAIKQKYPAQGITATGTTVTNYPISTLDSNNYYFTTSNPFSSGIKYGGVMWAAPVGDSMRITAPFGVLAGSSFVEGHGIGGLHGRLHWLLSGAPQGSFKWDYPDSVGQMSWHRRQLTGYRWYNHGIGGQTSGQLRLRWYRDVLGDSIFLTDGRGSRTLSRKPFVVIFDGCGNDPYFGITPAMSIANLEWMAKSCQDNNIRFIVFNSPTGPGTNPAGYKHLETVNKFLESGGLDKYGAIVFDLKRYWSDPAWGYDGIHMRPDISSDGVHFTKAGYDSLSRWVFDVCKVPKITKLAVINELAPTSPVTNYAYVDSFTVQGVGYQMTGQSQELDLRAALTSDSVWVKAIDLTTIAGAGTQYGYGHMYWLLENNTAGDSLYTRKTQGSNAASTNNLDAATLVITPAKHYDEDVLQVLNAANDGVGMKVSTGGYTRMFLNRSTPIGTGAVLELGQASNGVSAHMQGSLRVEASLSNYIGFLEILRNSTPSAFGYGVSVANTGSRFALYSQQASGLDMFTFRGYFPTSTQTFGATPAALLSLKEAGFGNASGSDQAGYGVNLEPVVNQTLSSHINIQFTTLRIAPIFTSLVNTRARAIHTLRGNNYFNSVSDSAMVGRDSTATPIAKFDVKGGINGDSLRVSAIDSRSLDTAIYKLFVIDGDGRTFKTSWPTSGGSHTEGTYTPTVANETNTDAVSVLDAQYSRDGNMVIVSGTVNINATTAGVSTVFTLSLPFATTGGNIAGTFINGDSKGGRISISSNLAHFNFKPDDTANISYSFIFQYRIQ